VPDAALMLMSWALITVGAVAGMESLSRPRPDRGKLDEEWFRAREADLWLAMEKVSADARKGKYESGTFQGTQGKR
jgi:hypothetical protein